MLSERMGAKQAEVLRVGQYRQGAQGKMAGRIDEHTFLRGQCWCGRRIGKQTEDRERAESKREQNVVTFGSAPEEGRCGLEEVWKRMFVVQKGQEEFRAAFRAEKCR